MGRLYRYSWKNLLYSLSMKYLFLFCLLLSGVSNVMAKPHFPVFPGDEPGFASPHTIERPYQKSIAIYSHFASTDDVDVYQFSVSEADLRNGDLELLIGSLVPACEPLRNLLTGWALVGPAQQTLPGQVADLPEELRSEIESAGNTEGLGVLQVLNVQQGKVWHESYTDHYYFWQQRREVKVNRTGEYKILIWPLSGGAAGGSDSAVIGDYVLEFGDKEIWSTMDILYTLLVYPKLLMEKEIVTPGCSTSNLNIDE